MSRTLAGTPVTTLLTFGAPAAAVPAQAQTASRATVAADGTGGDGTGNDGGGFLGGLLGVVTGLLGGGA
ncbi:hypothetical protein ACIHEJ_28125 [Streptomyces sp. NPDC052301]|uniref:hypothetical protein n=1 Tax=Streptomyces sp. NPDC052301 TaxID=3365687 RepID=UPI0037D15091